jgi:3-oxoacyl-[acyl-carrier protein] reductase
MTGTTALFQGELAVITGSASNIGRAIALQLAREGAHVFLADINAEANTATANEVAALGGGATTVTTDLAARDGWRQILDTLGSAAPHMFVHAACPPRHEADHAMAVTEDTWDRMFDTNVRSGFFLARAIAERMIASDVKGRMAFITSLHAFTPRNLPHYSASKAGQTMVVKELARALGPSGIRVNAIAPGAIPGGGFNAAAYNFDGKIPLGRLGTANDIAAMTVAMLSDRFSAYVSGTTIDVDGGLSLHNWIQPTM